MPVFKFKCECGREFSKLLKARVESYDCECGLRAEVLLAKSSSTSVYETRSKYHGKEVRKGIEGSLKKRARVHQNNYELAEQIDKHGLDEAIRNKWDKKIKKI